MTIQVAIDRAAKTLTITIPFGYLKRLGRPVVVTANAFVYQNKESQQVEPKIVALSKAMKTSGRT